MRDSLSPASATIDAGRLLTLERRRMLTRLSLHLTHGETGDTRVIDNYRRPESAGILSERQIAKSLQTLAALAPLEGEDMGWLGAHVGAIADWTFRAMRDWSNSGYYIPRDGLIDLQTFNVGSVRIGVSLACDTGV